MGAPKLHAALQWKRSWSEDTVGDNWEDSSFITRPSGRRPRRKIDPIRGPRDAYLRPMIDSTGIRQRLSFKSQASGFTTNCKGHWPLLLGCRRLQQPAAIHHNRVAAKTWQ